MPSYNIFLLVLFILTSATSKTQTLSYEACADQTLETLQNWYNEDSGLWETTSWWILAWIAAYDLIGDQKYLDMARITFSDMANGWDEVCGGGVYWKKPNIAKSAVLNELFLLCAIRLHQRTGGNEKGIS